MTITKNIIIVTLLVAFGSSFQNGYLITVVNVPHLVLEEFVNETTQYRLDDNQLDTLWSIIVMSRSAAQIIGAILAVPLADCAGRKLSLIVISIPLLGSLALQIISYNLGHWELLLAGRFLHGLMCGAIMVIAPIFLNEIAPVQLRGAFTVIHHVFVGLGSLVAFIAGLPELLGTKELWPLLFLVPALPAFGLVCFLPLAAESPKFLLLNKHEEEKAVSSIVFYQGDNKSEILNTIEIMKQEVVGNGHEKSNLINLFSNPNFAKSIKLAIAFGFVSAFSGTSIINSYSTKIMHMAGIPSSISQQATLALGAMAVVVDLLLITMIECIGRKPLIIVGTWMSCTAQLFNFALQTAHVYYPQILPVIATNAVVIFTWGVTALSMSGVYNSVVPELFPQESRSAGKSLEMICFYCVSTLVGVAFLPLLHLIGTYTYLVLLIGPLVTLTIYITCTAVETKDKTIGQIMIELKHEKDI